MIGVGISLGLGSRYEAVAPTTDQYFSSPYAANVVAQLGFNGADAATTFIDVTGKTWTGSGSAQLDTAIKKYGTAALMLNGTGYISSADSNDWDFGTGDFTVEAWIYLAGASSADSGGLRRAVICGTNAGTTGWNLYLDGTGSVTGTGLVFQIKNSGVNTDFSVTYSFNYGQWYHVAATRQGTTARLFVDGVKIRETTNSANVQGGTGGFRVGDGFVAGYLWNINGSIDNLRILKGAAAYTADFTPADLAYYKVSALLHFNGTNASTTFADVTGKTWTAAGNAQISTAQSKFGGASGLFDGNGDYISTPPDPSLALVDSDFTIEFWMRPGSVSAGQLIFDRRNAADATGVSIAQTSATPTILTFRCGDSSNLAFEVTLNSTTTLVVGTWYHIAVTRSGSTFRLFVNGVMEASGTWDGIISDSGTSTLVGIAYGLASAPYNGNLDEMRITKGVARYTADFTPPTSAFPDS